MNMRKVIEDTENYDDKKVFGRLGIIPMRGCEELGGLINDYLKEWRYNDEGYIVKAECPRFATGEGKGVILNTVRGYDIFIISDCFNYSVTYNMYGEPNRMSPDDHFQDLKRIISALGGKARRITVFMPMLYESRQHRRFYRESLDCAVALQELEHMGVTNVLTFDAHDPRVQNAIPFGSFDTISPSYQMICALLASVDDVSLTKERLLLVSPDEGGMSRCLRYSSMLGLDVVMFYKRRDYSTVVSGRNPIVAHEFLGSDVEGKDTIIIDDMLSTGDSLIDIAKQLKKRGARRIFAFITFGLFCESIDKFDEAYEHGLINMIYTLNVNYRTPELKKRPWHYGVDVSRYMAKIIDALNYDDSISDLLNPHEKIKNLLERINKDSSFNNYQFSIDGEY